MSLATGSKSGMAQPPPCAAEMTAAAAGSGAKRKASERQNDATDVLGPCDACRSRRVKCIRLGSAEDDPACEACLKRNTRCTNDRNRGQRYRPRLGKRIAAALATFGPDSDRPPSPPSGPPVNHHQRASANGNQPRSETQTASAIDTAGFVFAPNAVASPSSVQGQADQVIKRNSEPRALSEHTAEGRLGLAEESESLMALLMDSYIQSQTFMVPLVRWTRVQERFQQAGRRLQQLHSMVEPIALACIAFGALVSDHPLIVGSDAPRLHSVSRLGSHHGLAHWARRRQGMCNRLRDRVIELVDQRGCFRFACTESVSALGVASDLIAHTHGKQMFHLCRPYWAAQIAHLRHMRDTADEGNDLWGHVNWHLGVDDAFRSANEGKRLMMSDDEMEEHFQSVAIPEPSLEKLAEAVTRDRTLGVRLVRAFWFKLITTARNVAKRISIPLAQNRRVPVSAFSEMLADATMLFNLSREAAQQSQRARVMMRVEDIQQQTEAIGSPIYTFIEPFPLAVVTLFMIFYKKWNEWQAPQRRSTRTAGPVEVGQWSIVAIDGVEGEALKRQQAEEEREERKHISAVDKQLQERLVDGVCLVAAMIEERKANAYELFSHLNPLAVVRFHFRKMASIAMMLPCAELGGPVNYPFETQCWAAQTLIDGLHAQAWVWPDMQESAEKSAAELSQLRSRLAHRRAVAAATSAALPMSNSGSAPVSYSPSLAPRPSDPQLALGGFVPPHPRGVGYAGLGAVPAAQVDVPPDLSPSLCSSSFSPVLQPSFHSGIPLDAASMALPTLQAQQHQPPISINVSASLAHQGYQAALASSIPLPSSSDLSHHSQSPFSASQISPLTSYHAHTSTAMPFGLPDPVIPAAQSGNRSWLHELQAAEATSPSATFTESIRSSVASQGLPPAAAQVPTWNEVFLDIAQQIPDGHRGPPTTGGLPSFSSHSLEPPLH